MGELRLSEQKVLPTKAEEHWQSSTKLSLKEEGGLKEHVESWKEGLEKQCCTSDEKCQPASEMLKQHRGVLRNVG